ncbi:MAG: hypothetical protein PHE06_14155 [Lachnospiraceae bacterium]|nr:hypothetical protein [Lachnospiraceae bacterium]MDD3797077.1 hypothetical protein [Lachnospiraceae bacterium]
MKRKMGILVALVLFTTLLAGCGKNTEQQTTKELNFEGVTFSDFKVFKAPQKSLRSMAASKDGTAIYTGHIGLGANGVRKFDVSTGELLWSYHDAIAAGNIDTYHEYPKGIAVDDRGYAYAMITYNDKTGADLAILNDEDGSEVSLTFMDFGQIDSGANGIAVRKDGDKYYAYFISNYGPNRIYCYDVTDPTTPVLNTDFGVDGFVNLAHKTEVEGADANYIVIADNGDMYVTIKLADGSKADAIAKLSSDGKTFEKVIDCAEAYGISIADGYILVSTYEGEASAVKVYKLSDYSLVATLGADVESHGDYSQVLMIGNRLYVADQGYQTGASADDIGSRILVSGELGEK